MAGRRHPEDSVIVSIGDVHDMLAEDVGRQHEATQPRFPVPMAVPTELVGGVPSLEELGASRQARWQGSNQRLAPVRALPPWRVWRRRLLLAAGAVGVAAATAGVMWWLRPPSAFLEVATTRVAVAEREARLDELAAESERQRGALVDEVSQLRSQVQTLEADLASARLVMPVVAVHAGGEPVAGAPENLGAEVEQAGGVPAVVAPKIIRKPRPRAVARSPRAARTARAAVRPADALGGRKPRQPRKPLGKTDQQLDALLQGL